MAGYQIQSIKYERELEIARLAKVAAEATHCAFMAQAEVDEINRIIATADKNSMFACLQAKICKYRGIVVDFSPITNITIVNISDNEFQLPTAELLSKQLGIMKGFIYTHHALSGACRIAFQQCFDKMFKKLSFPDEKNA